VAYHLAFALYYGVQTMADSVDYISAADHITAFIQSDHVIRTPGYPWFMALLGNNQPLVIFVQHSLVILLASMLHVTLEKDLPRLAIAVFWVIGLHPWLAFWSNTIMTEILTLFFLGASFLALLKQKPYFAGLLVGISVLVRPSSLGALPALIVGVWLIHKEWRKALQVAAICSLVIVPWMVRNHHNAGTWSVSTVAGHTLWSRQAIVAGFPGSPWPEIGKVLHEKGELEGDRYFLRKSIQAALDHPSGSVLQFVRSAKGYMAYDLHFLFPNIEKPWTDSIRQNTLPMVGLKILFQYVLPFSVWSLAFIGFWHGRNHVIFQLSGLYLSGLSLVILLIGIGDTRLRLPSEIFLTALSTAGALFILGVLREKVASRTLMPVRLFETPVFAFLDRFQNR